MEKNNGTVVRLGCWLGLTGSYTPRPGETRPLWYKIPKRKYLAISIPLYSAALVLFFVLLYTGVYWSHAALVSALFFAVVMLAAERSTIKYQEENSGSEKKR